jgi:hypothetical protein
MTDQPLLPQTFWDTRSPEAQAAVIAVAQFLEERIAELEERVNKNSTNSFKPPSSDPFSVKRRLPNPASGKKRGGQPGPDSERALRHGVIYRKLSGGTESEAGSWFVERILSVVATCRQRDIHVLEHLTRCYQVHLDGQPIPSLLPAATDAQAA